VASAPERSSRIPFRNSLSGRLLLVGILPAGLLLVAVLTWNAFERFRMLELEAEDELLREALVTAADIEHSNVDAVRTARLVAAAQESGLFGDRARTIEILRGVLAASPGLTGVYVGYEPDADGNDAESVERDPPEWREESGGRFLPYVFRDWTRGNAIAIKPLVDHETSLYYRGCRELYRERGVPTEMVTEPYLYEGQLIVEQTYPILRQERFVGIGGSDRSLDEIERIVRSRSSSVGATAYLVSGRGNFVVATEDPALAGPGERIAGHLRTTPVAESRIADLLAPFLANAGTDGFVENVFDPRDGSELLAAGVRIPTGGWTLVFTRPREAVVGPIRASVIAGSAVVLLPLALSGLWLARTSLVAGGRLRQAADMADAISGGDLTVPIADCPTADEVGVLFRSLQAMRSQLATLLGEVKRAGVTLDTSVHELSASSREQALAAQRFGESTSEIAAAARQISATGRDLNRTMGEVDGAVRETNEFAGASRTGLAAADATIRGLAEGTESIAAKLARISERAEAITAVVTTIAKVADQTNLLSVNAAIEAEKAGEEGKGFLVVAREIRRLADRTAAATLDIEAIVREMQGAVGAGVMEMDRFAQNVRHGVDRIVDSSRQMGEIIERVEANGERFRVVAEGVDAQSSGAATISSSLSELVASAKRSAEGAEEFTRTAAELQRASGSLRNSVGRFRTD